MTDPDDHYDRDHGFKPHVIDLQGSCEVKIYLTDSQIKKLEEEESEDDAENEESS